MKSIDNISVRLGDDLKRELRRGGMLRIAASAFSIYAYDALREELGKVEGLEFIFTRPTFVTEKLKKENKEFFIPNIFTESQLCGGEFEIRLKNELTQRAVAKECAEWIRRKAHFKSNTDSQLGISGSIMTDNAAYLPVGAFNTADLGFTARRGFPQVIAKMEGDESHQFVESFKQIWNDKEHLRDVTDSICKYYEQAYQDNSPEYIYYITLYHIFNDFLEDISGGALPDDKIGFRQTTIWNTLYNFQQDAVLGAIHKLEEFNGCIIADSVGLGKTYTALAIIKYYNMRNKDVLVLCPRKLESNWNTYCHNDINNPLASDRIRYDVLFHTDLSRKSGMSNGRNLETVNWGNYGLVVIDESHNFRNTNSTNEDSRYQQLLNKVIRKGIETKVLMLSATPVNNRFNDLKSQLALAYKGDTAILDDKLDIKSGVDKIFRDAQTAFNRWSKLETEERTTDALIDMLDFDFFELLDSLTIARSRKHIKTYYDTTAIGSFPKRNKPVSLRPRLTKSNTVCYKDLAEKLSLLSLAIYSPLAYLKASKKAEYAELYGKKSGSVSNLTQIDKEKGIRKLMAINLLKRIESSVYAFELTLKRIYELITSAIDKVDKHEESISPNEWMLGEIDFENEDEESLIGNKVPVRLRDMDTVRWKEDLEEDKYIIEMLLDNVRTINAEDNIKLDMLKKVIADKIASDDNGGNRKVLIFTAFADTANYLYNNLYEWVRVNYGLHTAMVTGQKCSSTSKQIHSDLNTVLTCFSPKSKGKAVVYPNISDEIDILVATDCISEGQNLQDCDCMVNYDIHWNPVRIVQRFGRIDRIGSTNKAITMVNFWPDVELDTYIQLKQKVEDKMTIGVMVGAGDDNPLDANQREMEYRKRQLLKLQNEVIDLEDARDGICITDLGLNDFRIDLSNYLDKYGRLDNVPTGLYGVVTTCEGLQPGVIFILKNVHNEANIDKQNRLHPYYMVYIGNDGEIVLNHIQSKKILDLMKQICKGNVNVNTNLCNMVDKETDDGRNMNFYSDLLRKCVKAILNKEEQSGIQSLFKAGGTSFGTLQKGVEDFVLITFLIIR